MNISATETQQRDSLSQATDGSTIRLAQFASRALADELTGRIGVRAAETVALDLSQEAVGPDWVASVEGTSRALLDTLGETVNASSLPIVVVLRVDDTHTAVSTAARNAVKGVIGVAALEAADTGRRVNAVAINQTTTDRDLRATVEYLSDDDAAGYTTGITIDLTRQAPGHQPVGDRDEAPILVTGGAGGLGRAYAEALVAAGRKVIISDLESDALRATADELNAPYVACDVTSAAAVEDLAKNPLVASGLAGLAVYHGVGGSGGIGQLTPGVRDRSLVINGTGVYNVVNALVPALQRGRPGSVMILASQAGLIAERGGGAYCAAKFAAVGYAEALAEELSDSGVRVHSVCPGPVDTALLRNAFAGMAAVEGMSYDEYRNSRMQEIPLRRFGQPEQIAAATSLLLDLDATGVVLPATGGIVLT
ncbi:SDR family NAD(P)-dependent oxidoreductase [Rhodococcus sp. NPDC057014]|uniref:SDR family NAD(P)-dependent oxidoreductase n=1 Tax=Rhodococcus sp. NPDC057014 TaxID=3346000 RepID=UPI0036440FB1